MSEVIPGSAPPRVLMHVQHLLGTGHLRRMAAIAAALAARGAEVVLLSGGFPLPDLEPHGARLMQLPPARAADMHFRTLVTADGSPADDAWRERRRIALLEAFATTRPDVLVIEHFPFGRRLVEFELLPLIEAARARRQPPLIASSVRDVLVAKPDPARRAAMVARAAALFDLILFHGDDSLLPLSASLPEAAALGAKLLPTGYVATPVPSTLAPAGEGEGEIIVSVGGGDVGLRLLRCSLAARELVGGRWRILTAATGMEPRREPGLVIEPNRPDFRALLARAALSVSQAGYNTVVDLLSTRTRAVLVPFAEHAETEQTLRAQALSGRGLAVMLSQETLTPAGLARGIEEAMRRDPPRHSIALDGAERSADLLLAWSRR